MYSERIANAWRIRICGHDKSAPYGCERSAITWRTPTRWGANIPPGVGADSSCPYPNITKYTYPFQQICVFALSNMRFRSPFRGCIRIRGHDKSAPTAANGLRMRGEHSAKHQRSPTKWAANTPPGVGADSSRPYPCITKYTYSHYQIRVSVPPHTHIHIINYVFLHYRIRVFTSSNTHIHFTEYAFSFPISWVHSYMRAR